MKTAPALAVALVALSSPAAAAFIEVVPLETPDSGLVTIVGGLQMSDIEAFRQKTSPLAKAIVGLESDGGNLVAGIEIGKLIRLRGFRTIVPNATQCASACAVAWLGGAQRFMGAGARIGFHAAYDLTDGQPSTAGPGNALLGAYLSRIGLSDKAIVYVTQAGPSSMTWLSVGDAQSVGIDVASVAVSPSPDLDNAPAPPTPNLQSRAESFLELYVARRSGAGAKLAPDVAGLYAQSVSYNGQVLPLRSVLALKRQFVARWPRRSYALRPDSVTIRCDEGAATCVVDAILDWSIVDAARHAGAVGASTLGLSLSLAGTPSITAETDRVIARRVATAAEIAPPSK